MDTATLGDRSSGLRFNLPNRRIERDVRFRAHNGLNSDIAPRPKSASNGLMHRSKPLFDNLVGAGEIGARTPALDDFDLAPFRPAQFAKPVFEDGEGFILSSIGLSERNKDTDAANLARLLRKSNAAPDDRRSSHYCKKLPPLHPCSSQWAS